MKIYYADTFVLPLPAGHRFPMEKYRMLREAVEREGITGPGELRVPEAAGDEALLRVHDSRYLERVVKGMLEPADVRRIGFPWSPELVERSRRSVGGTLAAVTSALEEGAAANLAGGTHHAFPDRGEGFCVFNDVAVAARHAQAHLGVRRVAVVDLDVHQGNGTAAIFRNDPSVFTLSVHGEANFPFRKEVGDLDLPLPDSAGDEQFLDAVREGVRRAVVEFAPELVLYLAGADAHEHDRLGRLAVTTGGLAERDRIVFAGAEVSGAAVALVMGGGYGSRVEDTVNIHLNSIRSAARWIGEGTAHAPTPSPSRAARGEA